MATKPKAQLEFEAKLKKRLDELFQQFIAYKDLPDKEIAQKVNEAVTEILNGFVIATGLMRAELMFLRDTGFFKASGKESFSQELLEAFGNVGSILDKQKEKTDNKEAS